MSSIGNSPIHNSPAVSTTEPVRFEYNGSLVELQGPAEQLGKLRQEIDSISKDRNAAGLPVLSQLEYARLVGQSDAGFGTMNPERLTQALSVRLGARASVNIRKLANQMREAQQSQNPEAPQKIMQRSASEIYQMISRTRSSLAATVEKKPEDLADEIITKVSALPLPPEDKAHLLTLAQEFAPDRQKPKSAMSKCDPGDPGRKSFVLLEQEKARLLGEAAASKR